MAEAVSDRWSMSGDPCPRYGSLETHTWSFFEMRRLGIKLRSQSNRRGAMLRYKIGCRDCGLVEVRRGLPG